MKGDENESTITITGYEKDVYAAQETIMKIVNEMVGSSWPLWIIRHFQLEGLPF